MLKQKDVQNEKSEYQKRKRIWRILDANEKSKHLQNMAKASKAEKT